MLTMFSTLFAMLTNLLGTADKVVGTLDDLASVGKLHSESLRKKTEVELNSELRRLEKELAALEAQ